VGFVILDIKKPKGPVASGPFIQLLLWYIWFCVSCEHTGSQLRLFLFLLFLFFFYADDLTALVVTTIRANRMGTAHFPAVTALNQID
jgi:hypothetical protein